MLTKRTKFNLNTEQYDVIRPKNKFEADSSFVNAQSAYGKCYDI